MDDYKITDLLARLKDDPTWEEDSKTREQAVGMLLHVLRSM